MGPVCRRMLARLVDDNPTGESGFRSPEVSATAVRHGWARYAGESGRIKFYAVTDQGREALAAWRVRNPQRT